MPSKSNHTTIRGRHVIDPLASTDTVSGHTAASLYGQAVRGTSGDSRALVRHQVRAIALETTVDLLAAEREELIAQVAALELKVEELENETASLERTVEYKEQRHHQMVDRYEHIIADKDEAYRELRQDLGATPTDGGKGPGFSIKDALRGAARRMKDLRRR